VRKLKYFLVYILPITVYFAFNAKGIITFFPVVFVFVLLPLVELLLKPDRTNFDQETMLMEKDSKVYDWILYLSVPIQVLMLISFLFVIDLTPLDSTAFYGKTFAMGLMCGVMGINIGHELGHRSKRWQQFLGEILLLKRVFEFHAFYLSSYHNTQIDLAYMPFVE